MRLAVIVLVLAVLAAGVGIIIEALRALLILALILFVIGAIAGRSGR